jgi:hypothetical protein
MDVAALPPWLQALLQRESGGNWGIVNSGGYSGGFQFGEGAARDSGTYSGDDDLTDNRFGGTFNIPGMGTLSFDQWLASPEAQLATMGGWSNYLQQQIRGQGLDRYIGQTVNGVPVTMEGLVTGAHLGGLGGVSSWLSGSGNPADSNGTRVGDYVAMGSGAGGGMSVPALAALAPAAGGQDMAWDGGLLGVPAPAPMRQSWLGGLLDIQPDPEQGMLGALINPQSNADREGWRQAAAALLQASAPSTDPSHGSLGYGLGAALGAYGQGREFGARGDDRRMREETRRQIEAAIAALPPEQQAWARANPDAFAQLMLERQFAGPGKPIVTDGGLVLSPDGTSMIADYRQPTEGSKPLEINGQLVDPTTGRVIGDYRTPETPKPIEINGQLVDPVTYQPIADFRTPEAAPRPVVTDGGLVLNPTTGAVIADYRAPEPPPDTFKDERSLAAEYEKLAAPFAAVQQSYSAIQNLIADPTGASDIAAVYALFKTIDPQSTVREGEFASAAGAMGLPDQIVATLQRLDNGEFLSPQMRQNIAAVAKQYYDQQQIDFRALTDYYTGLATRHGFDPSTIIRPIMRSTGASPGPTPAPAANAPAPGTPPAFNLTGMPDTEADKAYEQMPSGTVFVGPDGNTYVKP